MISSRLLKTGINNMSVARISWISRDSRARDSQERKRPHAKLNFPNHHTERSASCARSFNMSQYSHVPHIYKNKNKRKERKDVRKSMCSHEYRHQSDHLPSIRRTVPNHAPNTHTREEGRKEGQQMTTGIKKPSLPLFRKGTQLDRPGWDHYSRAFPFIFFLRLTAIYSRVGRKRVLYLPPSRHLSPAVVCPRKKNH